jgi:NTP pyrophosphatase (non-canonical NTP hydrolase)
MIAAAMSCSSREERSMSPPSFDELPARLSAFARERDWEQFHSPKNLAMAVAAEAGELLEHFQWLTESESRELTGFQREQALLEMADVLLYLVRLADQLGVDLVAAAHRKIDLNAEKYPRERSRGHSRKYTDL